MGNNKLANIVMFSNLRCVNSTFSNPKQIKFGFLFKSDLDTFEKEVIRDIEFEVTEDNTRYERDMIAYPIYILAVNNDTDTLDIVRYRLKEFFRKYEVRSILRW